MKTTLFSLSRLFFLAFALLFSSAAFAQEDDFGTKEEKDKIAQEVCDCMTSSGIELKPENSDKVKMQLGLCILQSLGQRPDMLEKISAEDSEEKQATMESFGEKIGVLMVTKCPQVFMAFQDEMQDGQSDAGISASKSLRGTIQSIDEGEFVTLVVKEEGSGRTHRLLWLEFFENASQVQEEYKKLKGKKIEVLFEERELYQVKLKDYTNFKIIKKLRFI
ncbi:hypothetical protein [Hugenholtzia roseola]|uniref:hypothetical protein n=1 Tax=Hugenholtzia roseola TaxID=1002 RepID=UPI0012B63C95|nr:hypothetical protein [Hugenholtzia roseola]